MGLGDYMGRELQTALPNGISNLFIITHIICKEEGMNTEYPLTNADVRIGKSCERLYII